MSAGSGGEAGREGLFVALKSLVATLLAISKTRAELLVEQPQCFAGDSRHGVVVVVAFARHVDAGKG